MKKSLVIVESPAKAKTIKKYLGKGFLVEASLGHVRDLPKSKMGVDLENGFEPHYIVIRGSQKHVKRLKEAAQSATHIFLAADPDREGEAICWHLSELLKVLKRPIERVEFDEITERAIKQAFDKPREIDMKLVNAQQSRRVLDRIVGYTLSPLLWEKVQRGLSAGRVQSVALRLVVEREKEIRAFVPQEYWTLEAMVASQRQTEEKFKVKLEEFKGEKIQISTGERAQALVRVLEKAVYKVRDLKEKEKVRKPFPPFTTSKLQQEAFNKLRYPATKTMKIAQQLYEGVELGPEGSVGLITYMRTDSVRIGQEAMHEVRSFIQENFEPQYLPEAPQIYKSRKEAQEAHETIRPTSCTRVPQKIKSFLTPEQFKLYDLIWKRFVASQMTAERILVRTAEVDATPANEPDPYLFRGTGQKTLFDGFSVLYLDEAEVEEDRQAAEEGTGIPDLVVGEAIRLWELLPGQHFTKPPPRYSDASLIKSLEENGIGRPSTYAPTVATIVERNYVRRERGYLHATDLGERVSDLLFKHFPVVMDLDFTARMEEELDEVEEGKRDWKAVIEEFYGPYIKTLDRAKVEMVSIKEEISRTNEECPQCGKPLVFRWSRHGKFIACSGFPACRTTKSIPTGVKCQLPDCNGDLVRRRAGGGRGASFYGCSNYPTCTYTTRSLPKPAEKI